MKKFLRHLFLNVYGLLIVGSWIVMFYIQFFTVICVNILVYAIVNTILTGIYILFVSLLTDIEKREDEERIELMINNRRQNTIKQ